MDGPMYGWMGRWIDRQVGRLDISYWILDTRLD